MVAPRRLISKRLGDLLLERKLITEEYLKLALKAQEERGGLLGRILVDLGYVSEEAIAQVVTAQYGFPYLPLKHYSIDAEILRLIPEDIARQYCLVPIDRIGDTLTVAMADPLNNKATEEIQSRTQCSVQIFVATITDILETIQRHYGASRG